MEKYQTLTGTTIEYETPTPELAEFLARVTEVANNPEMAEPALVDLIYGPDNPILQYGVLPGRGLVTKDVQANPVYAVLTDLLERKREQKRALREALLPKTQHKRGRS